MFKNIISLNIQESSYHALEKNRIMIIGCEIHTYNDRELKSWVAPSIEEEKTILHDFNEFIQSLNLQTTLILTYDGKEYDLKILLTRAMILNVDLSDLWSFQHIDLFDFLKKSTRLGCSNIFDVARILHCTSVGDQSQKEKMKMISPTVLAAEGRWKELEAYNNGMLSVIYDIFQKIKPYLFPEFRTDLLDSQPSQEGIFG
jgi:DNA polymerase elongation subunit (family B)